MLPDFAIPYWDSAANGKPAAAAYPRSTAPARWHCQKCDYRWPQRIAIFIDKYPRLLNQKISSLCPACDGKVTRLGIDDLATLEPRLAALWSKDNKQPLSDFTRSSQQIGKWDCPEGHTWNKRIKDQVQQQFCRKCARAAQSKSGTSQTNLLISEAAPELYAELDAEKNLDELGIDVATLTVKGNSNLDLNWTCPQNHSYAAKFGNRYKLGRGCPKCSGREAIPGETDILTTDPEIVNRYWDYQNNTVSPTTVKRASNKEYNWHCEKNHSWPAQPATLTVKGQFCPFCSGKRLIPNENDLATVCPLSRTYWHPTKNGMLTPEMVTAGLRQKAAWQCPTCNYEYDEDIFVVSKSLNVRGKYCAACSGKVIIKNNNDFESQTALKQPERHLLDEWDEEENDALPAEIAFAGSYNAGWKCRTCNHKWRTQVYHRTGPDRTGCPKCAAGAQASKAEAEIADWLTGLGVTLERHVRNKLDAREELDIWVPSHKLAIEYNGVFWHSDWKSEDKNRHVRKYQSARSSGIRLIQVWEDDWLSRKDVVKSLILHRLGLQTTARVFARKTTVIELDKQTIEQFFESNHIQGAANGSHYIALKFEDRIVAAMVLKNEAGTGGRRLNIVRYATATLVPGGFTKLLRYAERNYQPTSFITFSDNSLSDGKLYSDSGFIAEKELPPDYMYVVGNQRRHKFGYRIDRFREDPDLLWQEGLTERELAKLNGLNRIWDAGKVRWVLRVENAV